MGDPRHALGHMAEHAVEQWLTRAGWTVLARRLRAGGGGEVDLIALDPSRILVAVEVRARRTHRTGAACATLDRRRMRRLEATLVAYAAVCGTRHRGLRVDLVTVEPVVGSERDWHLRRHEAIGYR